MRYDNRRVPHARQHTALAQATPTTSADVPWLWIIAGIIIVGRIIVGRII
jgi:hypothetical protein